MFDFIFRVRWKLRGGRKRSEAGIRVPEIRSTDDFKRFDAVVCDVDYAACFLELLRHDPLVDEIVFCEQDVHV